MKYLPLTAENLLAIDEEFRRKKAESNWLNQEADQWSLCGAVSEGGANSPSPRTKAKKTLIESFETKKKKKKLMKVVTSLQSEEIVHFAMLKAFSTK